MDHEHTEFDRKCRSYTYLQYIRSVQPYAYEDCLKAVQNVAFAMLQPAQFAYFRGAFADIGIVHLGLPADRERQLLVALGDTGVRIPGTGFVLRVARINYAYFEAKPGDFPLLPNHWLEGVSLLGNGNHIWIGRRHPGVLNGSVDLSQFREAPGGFGSSILNSIQEGAL